MGKNVIVALGSVALLTVAVGVVVYMTCKRDSLEEI